MSFKIGIKKEDVEKIKTNLAEFANADSGIVLDLDACTSFLDTVVEQVELAQVQIDAQGKILDENALLISEQSGDISSLSEENKEFSDILKEDIRVKATWLEDKQSLEVLSGDISKTDLFALKKRVDENYNEMYDLEPKVELKDEEVTNFEMYKC